MEKYVKKDECPLSEDYIIQAGVASALIQKELWDDHSVFYWGNILPIKVYQEPGGRIMMHFGSADDGYIRFSKEEQIMNDFIFHSDWCMDIAEAMKTLRGYIDAGKKSGKFKQDPSSWINLVPRH